MFQGAVVRHEEGSPQLPLFSRCLPQSENPAVRQKLLPPTPRNHSALGRGFSSDPRRRGDHSAARAADNIHVFDCLHDVFEFHAINGLAVQRHNHITEYLETKESAQNIRKLKLLQKQPRNTRCSILCGNGRGGVE